MLIMHRCQPLVLIFQLFKILKQRTLASISLNPDFIPKFYAGKETIIYKFTLS